MPRQSFWEYSPSHGTAFHSSRSVSVHNIVNAETLTARAPFRNYAKPIRGSIPSRAFHRTYSSSHKRYGKVSSTLSSMTTRYPGSSHERYSWRQFCMNTSSWSLKRCSKKSRRLSAKNSSGRSVQKNTNFFAQNLGNLALVYFGTCIHSVLCVVLCKCERIWALPQSFHMAAAISASSAVDMSVISDRGTCAGHSLKR